MFCKLKPVKFYQIKPAVNLLFILSLRTGKIKVEHDVNAVLKWKKRSQPKQVKEIFQTIQGNGCNTVII